MPRVLVRWYAGRCSADPEERRQSRRNDGPHRLCWSRPRPPLPASPPAFAVSPRGTHRPCRVDVGYYAFFAGLGAAGLIWLVVAWGTKALALRPVRPVS